jgi:hypothetical protein
VYRRALSLLFCLLHRPKQAEESCREYLWLWAWKGLEWQTWPLKRISSRSRYTGESTIQLTDRLMLNRSF